MTAGELRQASGEMRRLAEGVTSGAQWTDGHYWITDYDPSDPSGQTAMQRLIGGMDQPDAAHYSSWHPAVALAVADLLDLAADLYENGNSPGPRVMDAALMVCETFLGTTP